MFRTFSILCFMILANNICGKINQWETLENRQGYFTRLKNNNFVLVVFIANNNDQVIDNLKIVENLEIVKNNKIDLILIDLVKLPFFKNHYKLPEGNHMKFYLRSKWFDFTDFHDKILKNKFKLDFIEFLQEKIELLTKKLENFDDFLEAAAKKDILGIYLGDKNINYESFFDLSVLEIDFDFYHIFNKNLKRKILEIYERPNKEVLDNDIFIILRNDKLIDKFDEKSIVIYNFNNKEEDIKEFFDFERYPKLRRCLFHKINLRNLYIKRQKMLLHFILPQDNNKDDSNYYHNLIKNLPKKLIYEECPYNYDQNFNTFAIYFEQNNIKIKPYILYYVYVDLNQKIVVEEIKKGQEINFFKENFDFDFNSKLGTDLVNNHFGDL